MLFDLSLAQLAALTITLVGASYVRGYLSFGLSEILIVSASLITNPIPLIPVIFMCEIILTSIQGRDIRRRMNWQHVTLLLVGAAKTLPFAFFAILAFGSNISRLAVSDILLVLSLTLLSGFTLTRVLRPSGHMGFGAISGLCNAAGIGGFPVVASTTTQRLLPLSSEPL